MFMFRITQVAEVLKDRTGFVESSAVTYINLITSSLIVDEVRPIVAHLKGERAFIIYLIEDMVILYTGLEHSADVAVLIRHQYRIIIT